MLEHPIDLDPNRGMKVTIEFSLCVPDDGMRAQRFCELLHRAMRENSRNAIQVLNLVCDGMRLVSPTTPADRPAPRGWEVAGG